MAARTLRELQQSIAANVLRLRRRRGLTQEQLAEAAELDPRYIQQIERARTNLSLSVFVALAEALGVAPAVLLRKAALPPAKIGRPAKRPGVRRGARAGTPARRS